MGSVYTRRVLAANLVTAAVNVSVPAGRVWVVVCATLMERTGPASGNACGVWINQTIIFDYVISDGTKFAHDSWQGRLQLAAGEQVGVIPVKGGWDSTITVYDFEA